MINTNRRWYVAQTHGGSERLAKFHLERQAFEVYLPMMMGEKYLRPFLPKYLFVKVDVDAERWRAIYSTIGIKTLISAGDRPKPIHESYVNDIKDREIDGLVHLTPSEVVGRFKTGDKLRLKNSFIEAVFAERIDAKRSAILVSFLGRDSRQIVDTHRLELA